MLAIVEHQQRLARAQVVEQRFHDGPPRLITQAKRRGDRLRHQGRVSQGSQSNEPDPVRIFRQQRFGRLERQAGLAHPARPDQGDQALFSQARLNMGDFILSPKEAVDL